MKKKLHANDCSLGHLTLSLSLHYLVKRTSCRHLQQWIHTGQCTHWLRND